MKTLVQTLSLLVLGGVSLHAKSPNVDDARDYLADPAKFIASKSSGLLVQKNSIDIFGRSQNPDRPVPQTEDVAQAAPVEPDKTIPFQKIVDGLPISIMDAVNDVIVFQGSGSVQPKQVIEVPFEGDSVQLRFEGVRTNGRATGAYFRDPESGKLFLAMNNRKLPGGIQRGAKPSGSKNGIQRISPKSSGGTAPIRVNLATGG